MRLFDDFVECFVLSLSFDEVCLLMFVCCDLIVVEVSVVVNGWFLLVVGIDGVYVVCDVDGWVIVLLCDEGLWIRLVVVFCLVMMYFG